MDQTSDQLVKLVSDFLALPDQQRDLTLHLLEATQRDRGRSRALPEPSAAERRVLEIVKSAQRSRGGGGGFDPDQTPRRRTVFDPSRIEAYGLTPRETEILVRLCDGLTNKEIGQQLGISARTVEVHRGRIVGKFAARNTAELIRLVTEEMSRTR